MAPISRRTVNASLGVLFLAGLAGSALADDAAQTVLITGSNRGIGLEFVKQYAARGLHVIATTRNPEKADALKELAAKHSNVQVEALDVTKGESIAALVAKLAGKPIDILINNVGDTGEFKGQSFGKLDHDSFGYYMQTNANGAIRVSEAFIKNVEAGKGKKILAVSSLAGSFGAKSGGQPGGYWYKASKAALNMLMLSLSTDLKSKGITVDCLSPGVVDTHNYAAKGIRLPNIVPVQDSVGGMIKVIDGLTLEQSGQFIRYSGELQPW